MKSNGRSKTHGRAQVVLINKLRARELTKQKEEGASLQTADGDEDFFRLGRNLRGPGLAESFLAVGCAREEEDPLRLRDEPTLGEASFSEEAEDDDAEEGFLKT